MSLAQWAIPFRVVILAFAFLALALGTEWISFFELWRDSLIYNHGFLVAAGVLFLLYTKRRDLLELQPGGSIFALAGLTASVAALILAQTADIRVLQLFVTPFILLFWGWAIWGKPFAKTAGGPIMLLLFAVPFWDDFSPPLQHITVFFNEILLNIADVPAQIEEFYITLEVGVFLVEGGCSGIRYLIVGVFLATFYSQLFYRSYPKAITLVLAAAFLSMLANWIRVFGIILAGHYTDMESSMMEDHELFGWVVFVIVALIPLFLIAGKLERKQGPEADSETLDAEKTPGTSAPHYRYAAIASTLVLLPLIVPIAVSGTMNEHANNWQPELFRVSDKWAGPLKHADFWHPAFQNPDIEMAGVYVSGDLERIQAQFVGYRQQDQGKELIYFKNSLFDPTEWRQLSETTTSTPAELIPGLDLATETVIQNKQNGRPVIVWSWYQLPHFRHHSGAVIKLVGSLKKLSGDGRGALVALAAHCGTDAGTDNRIDNNVDETVNCDAQRTILMQFLAEVTDYP
jgi:exosortase A